MAALHMMGFEQEMALCATVAHGAVPNQEALLNSLCAVAAESLVHLRGLGEGGIFLANGSRLYVDCLKYEFAGPECTSPDEVVKFLIAGERILAPLASEVARRNKLDDVGLYRANIDYASPATWGAHESYLTRKEPSKLSDDLIPFLVARVVTAGAGGFRPLTCSGCTFTLSPRAWHIFLPVSQSSTGSQERGIFHTKDQTLSCGYHRVHILVGDALCSRRQNWLKFATTSLVTAMADAGLHPGQDVMLRAPVQALRAFASDPTCRMKARTQSGRDMSAVEIQRHYLELARRNAVAEWMPDWACEAIDKWGAMLDRLDGAPDSVATCLDWAIKYRAFQSHIERRGFSHRALGHWTNLTDVLCRCSSALAGEAHLQALPAELVLDRRGPLRDVIAQLDRPLASRGMEWEQLKPYLKLRSELFALDFKFGRLGEKGIFNCLDRAGVLDHDIGLDDAQIESAIANPPRFGRAKLRGEAIKRLHGNHAARDASDWMSVYDSGRKMYLNLSNPFAAEEVWARNTNPTSSEFTPF
jgi:hypothetical protein